MTRSAEARLQPDAHLHTAGHLAFAALFLGAIAVASLPAMPGWVPAWLLVLPLASLAGARALLWSRRRARRSAPIAAGRERRVRPATANARRRPAARRPASRLLAAIALR